jgi:hypothetical protein
MGTKDKRVDAYIAKSAGFAGPMQCSPGSSKWRRNSTTTA